MRQPIGPASKAVAAASLLALAGCVTDPQAPWQSGPGAASTARPVPGRLTIVQDPGYLESRIERQQRALGIRPPEAAAPGSPAVVAPKASAAQPAPLAVSLTLVGHVLSPVVDGRTVQANDIDFDTLSRIAVVGYNVAGDVHAGAMQVIDFHTADHPVLVGEVLFHDADVNAVLKRGTNIYVGLASGDSTLASPALFEVFRLGSGGLSSTGQWIDLPSWAVTDLAASGNNIVAAVGAQDGGVVTIDGTLVRQVAFAPQADARAVCVDAAGQSWDVCGTVATLSSRALPALTLANQAAVSGYGFDGAKGTLESIGPYLYLGAGDGGFQVRDQSGALMEALDSSAFDGTQAGLAVVNAASVAGTNAYVAAGARGIQVVDLGRWDGAAPGVVNHGLQLLGQLSFDDGFSSNMVKARSNILVAAAGSGGVELVRMN